MDDTPHMRSLLKLNEFHFSAQILPYMYFIFKIFILKFNIFRMINWGRKYTSALDLILKFQFLDYLSIGMCK